MEFYQILILIIAGAIVIRFTFKFDLNKYLENRRKIKIDQLKNICPHGRIASITDDGKVTFESFFVSPVGTMDYVCSQCNVVVGKEQVNRLNERYRDNLDLVFEKQKEFAKRVKKLGLA